MQLSIVTTLYRSAPQVQELCRRLDDAARGVTSEYEIIVVDDGSPDEGLQRAVEVAAANPRVRVVELARNYGQYRALIAGLEQACGELVFLIDGDLEEEPELLPAFWRELAAHPDADAIIGVQRRRAGRLGDRMVASAYYMLLDWLTPLKVPRHTTVARLLRRRFVGAMLRFQEMPLSFDALTATVGLRQRTLQVDKAVRHGSSYTTWGRLGLGLGGVLGYSAWPIWALLGFGTLGAASTGVAGLVVVARNGLGVLSMGRATLLSVWFLGFVLLTATGMVGAYLALVLQEVRRRPVIVREVHAAIGSEGTSPDRHRVTPSLPSAAARDPESGGS